MQDRTNALYLNGMTFSTITVVTLLGSLLAGSRALLIFSGVSLVITVLSLIMSMLHFNTADDHLPLIGTLISFILLLPLATTIFIISFLFSIVRKTRLLITERRWQRK